MRLNEALSQISRCTIPDLQEDTELKILGEVGFFILRLLIRLNVIWTADLFYFPLLAL